MRQRIDSCGKESSDMPKPSVVLRYVKLPDNLADGKFDEYGNAVGPNQPASVVLHQLPGGPWQCWGVFDHELEPGQYGYLTFFNVPGQAVPGGAFTEWSRKASTPYFDDHRLMVLYSVQRAQGAARIIGRNSSGERVGAAAGLLFVAPPSPVEPPPSVEPPPPSPSAVPTPEEAQEPRPHKRKE
jgi:hypothetical protein